VRDQGHHRSLDKSAAKYHSFAMPGRVYAALFETAVEQYGYITAKDARELGFGPGI
jgi:hypothetical protein